MDDDIDIYEDLPIFDSKDSEKYKEEIKDLSQKCKDFQQENAELKLKISELSDSNKLLSVNLSSLLKTAKAEISRKDRMITELRQELDNMAFRRSGHVKPKAKEFPKKIGKNNTYASNIRQESLPVYSEQSGHCQNNTYATSIRQEPLPVYSEQSGYYQNNTYTSTIRQESLSVPRNQSASHREIEEEEIEDPEQKYEPEKIATTVFGERLRKKLLLEQEIEKTKKEEAKRAIAENEAKTVKMEEEAIKENGNSNDLAKNEVAGGPSNSVEENAVKEEKEEDEEEEGLIKEEEEEEGLIKEEEEGFIKKQEEFEKEGAIKSILGSRTSSSNSYEEDDRNLADRREFTNKLLGKRVNKDIPYSQQKRRRIEDERYHSDDMRYYNGNGHYEKRFNPEVNDNCRNSRNIGKHISRRRGSDYREDNIERDRRAAGEINKSNHRSRSRSPDRRYSEKRADRHRTDKYRAYMDTYENRRNNGINRKNPYNDKFNKDPYDIREKIDYRIEPKIDPRSEYNNYKHSKFEGDRRRVQGKTSPIAKLRSRSNGRLRDDSLHKNSVERSKSSNRLANIREDASDQFIVVDEFKLEKSPDKNCENKIIDEEVASSARVPGICEKKDMDKKEISSVHLTDFSENKETDTQQIDTNKSNNLAFNEIKNRNTEVKSQTSKVDSEKEVRNKQIASSQLSPDVFEKEVTNKNLTSNAKKSNISSSVAKMSEVREESKKQLEIDGKKSRDSEPSISEQKNRDSESTLQNSSRKSDEESHNVPVSLELLPDVSKKEVTNQRVVSDSQLPSSSASVPETYEALEIFRRQIKDARRKSKDIEVTIAEEKTHDSESKDRIKLEKSCEEEVKTKDLHSVTSLPEVSEKDLENQQTISTNQSLIDSTSASESNEVPEEIKKERKSARRKSKELEISLGEEKNRLSKAKLLSKEKEVKNKELGAFEPLSEVSKNDMTNQQLVDCTKLPNDLTSAEKSSEVPDEMKKQRRSSRTKLSKDPAVEDHKDRKSKSKSPLTRKSLEKEMTNKKIAINTELSNISNFASGAKDALEESKKQQKIERRKSKEGQSTDKEKKNCDPELKTQLSTKINVEKGEIYQNLVSCEPTVEDLISKLETDGISDQQKALNNENKKPVGVFEKIDNSNKWISSVLENDSEIPSIRLENSIEVGSRSFREEKIENIEKFIQNYQDEEELPFEFSKKNTDDDFDCGNKSCDSTRSILDTLSMDTDVANSKIQENVPDNSVISEQFLLDSLSTPVKMNNPPLPSISSLDKVKPPPLPSNSPAEEIKQPPLPPNSPPEATSQPSLPLNSPPGEEKQLSLPPNSSEATKQPHLPSDLREEIKIQLFPSSDKNQRTLPPLASPDDEKKNSSPCASSDEEKQQNPAFLSPEKNRQTLPSLLPLNEGKQSSLSPSSSSPNKNRQSPSHKIDIQEFSSSALDKKNQLIPPIESSNEKKQRIPSSHSSPDYKKRRLLSSILSSNENTEKMLAPASETKTSLDSSAVSALQKKKDQQLSSISVDKTKHELLLQSTSIKENDLPAAGKEGETLVLSAVLVQSPKNNSLSSEVDSESENSKLSSLPVATEKNLPFSLLGTPSNKINATSSRSPAPVDEKSEFSAPVDKKSQSSAPVDKKSQSSAPVDKKSQPSAPVDKKSQSSAPVDKKSQPSAPVDEKSELPVLANKKSQPPAPAESESKPPDSPDGKSQPPTSPDKKLEPSAPGDKKSLSSAPDDEKSLLPVESKKFNQPLPSTEESSRPSASSEKTDVSPTPRDKINEISEATESSTKKLDCEKSRPEKVTLKAISRRNRISCAPIVSRYARKTRNLVLTDSNASSSLRLKSDVSGDDESNNNKKIEIKTSPSITKEAKIILKPVKIPEPKDIALEKNISKPISKISKPEKLSTDVNICTTENTDKIKSDIPTTTSELQTTKKVEPVPEIIPSTLCNVKITESEKLGHNSAEYQSQLESKQETSTKSQNQDSNSEVEMQNCPKTAENRGSRSALKTIATPDLTGESSSVLASRKKPLTKEKENQSKQIAKPGRIMVVSRRRRPVTLEDSSTATTLVPSGQEPNCDRLTKSNGSKNTPSKNENPEVTQTASDSCSKGRKRRFTDK